MIPHSAHRVSFALLRIVTSTAWLDVGYGYALQRFILDHFKIVAILESRYEPWFEQAAVNTVVTVVERCESVSERDAYPARFVQIKRPLAELIPWDMHLEALDRWIGLDKLIQRIEATWEASKDPDQPMTYEDDDVRIRLVQQGSLRAQVESAQQTVKWGPLLRAPQVYFDLLKVGRNRLARLQDVADIKRGTLTRLNEFFYLDAEQAAELGIEEEFLLPVFQAPRGQHRIEITDSEITKRLFVCRLSKDELRAQGKTGALKYIEWGEQQRHSNGQLWSAGQWMQDRKPGWWSIPRSETSASKTFLTIAYYSGFLPSVRDDHCGGGGFDDEKP